MATFLGYASDLKALPVKRGDVVTIKKGARLKSMNPKKDGFYENPRNRKVKVNHILSGDSFTFGTEYIEPDGTVKFHCGQRQKDVTGYAERLGYEGDKWRPEYMEWLRSKCERKDARVLSDGLKVVDLVLHAVNPSVCWAGTGGYWVEADINDVVEVANMKDETNPEETP